jgi:hypothetical protein
VRASEGKSALASAMLGAPECSQDCGIDPAGSLITDVPASNGFAADPHVCSAACVPNANGAADAMADGTSEVYVDMISEICVGM